MRYIIVLLLAVLGSSVPLPLEGRADLIEAIKKTNLAVFFYGTQES